MVKDLNDLTGQEPRFGVALEPWMSAVSHLHLPFASVVVFVLFSAAIAAAVEDPPAGPVALKVVSKKDKYEFDGGGKTPKEYKAALEELAKQQADGVRITPPRAIPIDLVLRFENTSKENVTIHVNGTANVYTFDLTGGEGVVTLQNTAAMPLFFRLPTAVTIEPGKTYEIPVKSLADGKRGMARFLYWAGPGDYTVTAKYQLLDARGQKDQELTSKPIKIQVVEK